MSKSYQLALKRAQPFLPCPIESVREAIYASNELLSDEMWDGSQTFDDTKEAILWHGTRESVSDALVKTVPRPNDGAYGFGFYVTPHIGKADQYTIMDGTHDTLCLIAYRVILDGMICNPHLNGQTRDSQPPVSYIQQNRTGCPLRYHEVIVRSPSLSNMAPIACITYERYKHETDMEGSARPPPSDREGLRRRRPRPFEES